MEIAYQNTSRDLRAVIRYLPFRRRVQLRFGWILQLLACTLPGSLVLFALGDPLVPLVAWALLSLLFATRAAALAWSSHPDAPLAAITLRLQPDYLECETDQGCGRRAWSLVEQARLTEQFLLLHLSRQRLFAIPRRAFASRQQMQQAADIARRHALAARSQSSDTLAAPPDFPEPPGVPQKQGEDSVEVHFRNSAFEITRVRHYGLQQPAGPGMGGLSLAMLTVMMCAFLIMSRNVQGMEQLLASTLFLLLSSFAGLCLWTLARPLAETRGVPPEMLDPRTLVISPLGVWLRSRWVASFERWGGYQGVLSNEKYVALARRKTHELILIPKAAFAGSDDVRRFVKLASEAIERAPSEAAPADGEQRRPVVETGNPYQPPGL